MKSSHRWLLFFVVLSTVLRLPSLFEPYWHGDEGISLLMGQTIRRGAVLYRDLHDNKPPLLYVVYALGGTIAGGKLIALFWSLGSVSIFYKLAEKILTTQKSLVPTLLFVFLINTPLFEGNIVNGEIFFILPSIIGMYLLYTYSTSSSYWPFFLAGVSFALGALFKLPASTDFLAGILLLLFLRNECGWTKVVWRYFFLITGFLGPLIVVCIYFWSLKSLSNFVTSVLTQNVGYSGWQNYFLLPYLLSSGLLLLYLYVRKKQFASAHLFTLLWFFGALLGSRLSIRPYTHYLIQVLPPVALLVGLLFTPIKNKMITYSTLFLFIAVTITQFPFNFGTIGYQFGYYFNFILYNLRLQTVSQYCNFFDPRVERTYQTAEFIVKNTHPDESLFIWGDDPLIYALAQRLPVGKYSAAYHIMDWDKNFSDTIDHLEAKKPRYIFVSSERISVFPFPYLYNLLNQSYQFERAFADLLVYQRIK